MKGGRKERGNCGKGVRRKGGKEKKERRTRGGMEAGLVRIRKWE